MGIERLGQSRSLQIEGYCQNPSRIAFREDAPQFWVDPKLGARVSAILDLVPVR